MAIVCGEKMYRGCTKTNCTNCHDYVGVYTGKDFGDEVLKAIVDIYSEFSIVEICSYCNKYKSLKYMMGIAGHDAQFEGDLDDIYYLAGTIVLLQQHRFKKCSSFDKVRAYQVIKKLYIVMDEQMSNDYKKVIKKYRKKRHFKK